MSFADKKKDNNTQSQLQVQSQEKNNQDSYGQVLDLRPLYRSLEALYSQLDVAERNEGTALDGINAMIRIYKESQLNLSKEVLDKMPESIRYSGDIELIRSTVESLGLNTEGGAQ